MENSKNNWHYSHAVHFPRVSSNCCVYLQFICPNKGVFNQPREAMDENSSVLQLRGESLSLQLASSGNLARVFEAREISFFIDFLKYQYGVTR